MMGIQNYFCPDDKGIELVGNYFSSNFTYLSIKVKKCRNSTQSSIECKPFEDIETFFGQNIPFNMIIVNSYFQASDFDDPIKFYIDDQNYQYCDEKRTKFSNIYVQKSQVELSDDPYMISGT